jgi:hypothetical protein
MLVPLVAFALLYHGLRIGIVERIELALDDQFILSFAIALAAVAWLIGSYSFTSSLNEIKKINSLGEKLSRYASITIKWNAVVSCGMLLLVCGYLLTENRWITIMFIASLVLPAIRWPFPKRVCNDLALKGDERMIVLYRMDSF